MERHVTFKLYISLGIRHRREVIYIAAAVIVFPDSVRFIVHGTSGKDETCRGQQAHPVESQTFRFLYFRNRKFELCAVVGFENGGDRIVQTADFRRICVALECGKIERTFKQKAVCPVLVKAVHGERSDRLQPVAAIILDNPVPRIADKADGTSAFPYHTAIVRTDIGHLQLVKIRYF